MSIALTSLLDSMQSSASVGPFQTWVPAAKHLGDYTASNVLRADILSFGGLLSGSSGSARTRFAEFVAWFKLAVQGVRAVYLKNH